MKIELTLDAAAVPCGRFQDPDRKSDNVSPSSCCEVEGFAQIQESARHAVPLSPVRA